MPFCQLQIVYQTETILRLAAIEFADADVGENKAIWSRIEGDATTEPAAAHSSSALARYLSSSRRLT